MQNTLTCSRVQYWTRLVSIFHSKEWYNAQFCTALGLDSFAQYSTMHSNNGQHLTALLLVIDCILHSTAKFSTELCVIGLDSTAQRSDAFGGRLWRLRKRTAGTTQTKCFCFFCNCCSQRIILEVQWIIRNTGQSISLNLKENFRKYFSHQAFPAVTPGQHGGGHQQPWNPTAGLPDEEVHQGAAAPADERQDSELKNLLTFRNQHQKPPADQPERIPCGCNGSREG